MTICTCTHIHVCFPKIGKFFVFRYFRMACWYPRIKNVKIFDNQHTILFVVSPSLAPLVNNNRSLLLNFRIARRYPEIFVHVKITISKFCERENFLFYWYNASQCLRFILPFLVMLEVMSAKEHGQPADSLPTGKGKTIPCFPLPPGMLYNMYCMAGNIGGKLVCRVAVETKKNHNFISTKFYIIRRCIDVHVRRDYRYMSCSES